MITVNEEPTATAEPLQRLAAEGVSVWLDDLSRRRIASGDLARLVASGRVVGITTNPSIFRAAIGSGRTTGKSSPTWPRAASPRTKPSA